MLALLITMNQNWGTWAVDIDPIIWHVFCSIHHMRTVPSYPAFPANSALLAVFRTWILSAHSINHAVFMLIVLVSISSYNAVHYFSLVITSTILLFSSINLICIILRRLYDSHRLIISIFIRFSWLLPCKTQEMGIDLEWVRIIMGGSLISQIFTIINWITALTWNLLTINGIKFGCLNTSCDSFTFYREPINDVCFVQTISKTNNVSDLGSKVDVIGEWSI